MKKQELLNKWGWIFAELKAPLIAAEFEKDITKLLSDEETANNIIYKLDDIAREFNCDLYGLPPHQVGRMREQVKNIMNNEAN